jgi:hypothetical protein
VVAACNGTVFARDVANERSDVMDPEAVGALAHAVGAAHGMEVTQVGRRPPLVDSTPLRSLYVCVRPHPCCAPLRDWLCASCATPTLPCDKRR